MQRDEQDQQKTNRGRGRGGNGRGGRGGRALRYVVNRLDSDEESDVADLSSSNDEEHLPPELLDVFDGELPQIIPDPSEDNADNKENHPEIVGHKRKAAEPLADNISGQPKLKNRKAGSFELVEGQKLVISRID
jgi:hypothetical protein